MNQKEKLLEIYSQCVDKSGTLSFNFDDKIFSALSVISDNIEKQKGVFTVLITLGIHKFLFPNSKFYRKGPPASRMRFF